MRGIAVVLCLCFVVCMCAGCSEGPRDAGLAMAEKHIRVGMNPSPGAQAKMQAEVNAKISSYSLAEKQEFMEGYMEGVAVALQQHMAAAMGQAMSQASRSLER